MDCEDGFEIIVGFIAALTLFFYCIASMAIREEWQWF